MGKLTEWKEQKKKTRSDIESHNIFKNEEMKKLFLEQVENLDFFKCKVDNENRTYYLLKFRLDTSPLKVKQSSLNPYEFRLIQPNEIKYDNIVYDIEKHGWSEEEVEAINELWLYLVDFFTPKTDWALIEETTLKEDEFGKFTSL